MGVIMTLVERDQLVVKIKLYANLATWMQNKGDHNKHNELIRKAAKLFLVFLPICVNICSPALSGLSFKQQQNKVQQTCYILIRGQIAQIL